MLILFVAGEIAGITLSVQMKGTQFLLVHGDPGYPVNHTGQYHPVLCGV